MLHAMAQFQCQLVYAFDAHSGKMHSHAVYTRDCCWTVKLTQNNIMTFNTIISSRLCSRSKEQHKRVKTIGICNKSIYWTVKCTSPGFTIFSPTTNLLIYHILRLGHANQHRRPTSLPAVVSQDLVSCQEIYLLNIFIHFCCHINIFWNKNDSASILLNTTQRHLY